MDQNWENLFQGKILERGWNYYKTGKVDNFTVTDERISAVVEGTEYYHVDIELNQGEINGMYCSCPYAADGKNCKHMAAVLYAAAHEDNEDEGDFYDEDEDYVEYEYDYEQREYLSDLKELIVNADRKDLEKMLLTIAGNDKSTGKAIYKFLETDRVLKEKRATVKVTMRSLKAKADYIFRDRMICSVKSKEKKCALLAEEKLKDQLYALIAEGQEISLLDRYGFLLADAHGTEILKAYEKYVCEVASTVRNESGYNRLIGYLKRMCYYEGGRETTKRLAEKWREAYPTRKLMVQTLTEFIDQI